ncbi:MAG: PAS domain S-box protein [Tenuifilaceae bacterium]|jgi:PAS domain S-box-containing protein|nr:PAS domain S-box protein [Tenuifilaceae bacterium]
MFVIELIYNLSILVALSIISSFIDNRWSRTSNKGAILQGFLFGSVAMLGMVNPLVFDVGIVFDGRSVVLSLCALFFGPVAAAISAGMAIALRVYQGGAGAIMGVSVIVASAIIGVVYYYRRRIINKRMSSLFLLGFGILVHAVMLVLTFTLPYSNAISVLKEIGPAIIVFYPLATILIGKILYDQEVKLQSVQALRDSEELFRTLAQSSPVGIYKLSRNGTISFVNERWCEIMGFSVDEVIGKNHNAIVAEEDIDRVQRLWIENEKLGKTFGLEFRTGFNNSNSRWVFGQYEPIRDEFGSIEEFVGSVFDIDERKRTEEQLRLWENIFSSTRMGIVLGIGENPYFDIFNPAFADMYGYSKEELKEIPIAKVFAPEEEGRIGKEIKTAYQKGYHVFESWHVKKNGVRFPVLVSMTAIKDEHGKPLYRIVNVQDISERFEAEVKLRDERSRLANIIEGTNVGTWEWNVQTGHTVYNERWAMMIGYSLSEISPANINTWLKFVHPDDEHIAMEQIKRHFDRDVEYYQCEFRMRHKDGHWVWIQDRGKVTQWTEDGKPFLMFGIHIDITERKKWEEQLAQSKLLLKEQNEQYLALNEELIEINHRLRANEQQLKEQNEEYMALNEELTESNSRVISVNKELAEAKKKAEESDMLKSAFLANMSHEIRTPMNAIVGFSEILLRPNLKKEKQTLYTEVLNASCNQLLGIINDVLDISKIETGQVTMHKSEFSVNKLLRNLKSLFSHNASNKGTQIILSPGLPDERSFISTDEGKLNQILTNLLSNAIKFTDNGTVEIGYNLNALNIEFFVADTGIGISPENQALVFDRFRQVDSSATRSYGGTGLGLSICKAYVEMLGGHIRLESALGQGAKFIFTLPHNMELPRVNHRVAKPKNVYNFKSKVILVAEDEAANFLYLNELLSDTGAQVIHVDNGLKAVEVAEGNPNIDIILMDIKMPIMNGMEATKTIRQMQLSIPIVALTAYAMSGDKEKCIAAGCNDYISKPILKDDLLSIIELYLKK